VRLAGAGHRPGEPAAGIGVAIREFVLKEGHGRADYLLFVNGQAVGAIEAKSEGTTLTGVEFQTARYLTGLPDGLPAPIRPLPFANSRSVIAPPSRGPDVNHLRQFHS